MIEAQLTIMKSEDEEHSSITIKGANSNALKGKIIKYMDFVVADIGDTPAQAEPVYSVKR